MTDHRDTARKVEVTTSVAAGSVGAGLGATKLRDAFKEEHEATYARGEARLARTAGPKVARFVAHAKPGFKPLAAGTVLAVTATGANKYRQKKDHELARSHLVKAAPNWAILKSTGRRVRVLHQHSTDHFMVLDHHDTQRLVHRNHITFIKTKVVAKSADHLTDGLDQIDARARKLRAKAIPSKLKIVQSAAGVTGRVKDDVQRSLAKAYDPKRGQRRRARALELGAGAGAAGAATSAVRDHREASRHFLNSSGEEAAARSSFRLSRLHGGNVATDLEGYAQKARHGNRPGTPGRAISGPNVGTTLHTQKRSYDQLERGTEAFTHAFQHGQAGHRLIRRANKTSVAAAGLGAVAVGAHRAVKRNKHS